MTGMCPRCGHNFEADVPISVGAWRIDPRLGVLFEGRRVTSRTSWTTILHTLAREEGRYVMPEALQARISESDHSNIVASQISQLRRCLRERGVPDPVESEGPGRASKGYRWAA